MKENAINRRCKQLLLDDHLFKQPVKQFGGKFLKNSNPKIARPISTKKAMHVVLRSSIAKNELSFLSYKRRAKIEKTILKQAKLFNIKVYKLAINGNHIHLLIKLYFRDSYSKFIRAVTGLIARITLGIERGKAKLQRGCTRLRKFWDYRPFTRIVEWARDFNIAKEYVIQNLLEAAGIVPYKTRKSRVGTYLC